MNKCSFRRAFSCKKIGDHIVAVLVCKKRGVKLFKTCALRMIRGKQKDRRVYEKVLIVMVQSLMISNPSRRLLSNAYVTLSANPPYKKQ